jgi:hypothetical protein
MKHVTKYTNPMFKDGEQHALNFVVFRINQSGINEVLLYYYCHSYYCHCYHASSEFNVVVLVLI